MLELTIFFTVPYTSRSVSAQGDYDCEPDLPGGAFVFVFLCLCLCLCDCEPDLPGDAPEGKKEEVVKVEAVPPATTYFANLKQ